MEDRIEVPWYRHVTWDDVRYTDVVWLQGRAFGRAKAYGPYQVLSNVTRELRNQKGNVFMHYAEDLLVPTWGMTG